MNTLRTELNTYNHMINANKEATMTMGKGKRLTAEDKNMILDKYRHGFNGKEIHDATKLSYQAIVNYLRKVKTRRGGVEAAQKANEKKIWSRKKISGETIFSIKGLAEQGYTAREIAKKVGVSVNTADRYMKGKSLPKSAAVKLVQYETSDIDKKIMEAEMRLQILKELKNGK